MPRQYQRKTTRGTFTKHAIEMAVAAYLEGKSLRKVASDCGVNYKTLQRYVKLHKTDGNIEKATFGYSTQKKRIFSDEQEQVLLDYIIEASIIYYGLNLRELRKLAYEAAVANKIPMPESWSSAKAAGEDWLKAFRQRHKDKLSLMEQSEVRMNPQSLKDPVRFNDNCDTGHTTKVQQPYPIKIFRVKHEVPFDQEKTEILEVNNQHENLYSLEHSYCTKPYTSLLEECHNSLINSPEKSISPGLNDDIKNECPSESETTGPSDEAEVKIEANDVQQQEGTSSGISNSQEKKKKHTIEEFAEYIEQYKDIEISNLKLGNVAWLCKNRFTDDVANYIHSEIQKHELPITAREETLFTRIRDFIKHMEFYMTNINSNWRRIIGLLETKFFTYIRRRKKPLPVKKDKTPKNLAKKIPPDTDRETRVDDTPIDIEIPAQRTERTCVVECQRCLNYRRTYKNLMSNYKRLKKRCVEVRKECNQLKKNYKFLDANKKLNRLRNQLRDKNVLLAEQRKTSSLNKKLLLDLTIEKGKQFQVVRYYKKQLKEKFGVEEDDIVIHPKVARRQLELTFEKLQKLQQES
ncbi:uncharacterized protein LOC131932460 [Physella acuta]|uniref:uncharacterized protein LOC131932460 n=1 Tax=Physella acuta TaxID=109671 RepID=UPI0027DC98E6|nr:uncharacterized protein LOC131932460 [Physella acuta]